MLDWHLLGYPVCHQLVNRSFYFGGDQVMPLCARCSGVYVGFLASIISLTLMAGENKRGVKLPQTRYLIILFIFIFVMGLDVFADRLRLYEPNNYLRLLTGLLMGVSLANFILPVFNFTFWLRNDKISLLDGPKLFKLILINIIIFGCFVILGQYLFWLLALLSILGVITLYLYINSLIYLIISKKENQAKNHSDLLNTGLIAGLMSALEFLTLSLVKSRFLSGL